MAALVTGDASGSFMADSTIGWNRFSPVLGKYVITGFLELRVRLSKAENERWAVEARRNLSNQWAHPFYKRMKVWPTMIYLFSRVFSLPSLWL